MKTGKYFLHNDFNAGGKKGQMASAEQMNVHSVKASFSHEKKMLVEGESLAPLLPLSSLDLLQCQPQISEENRESGQEHTVVQSNLAKIVPIL